MFPAWIHTPILSSIKVLIDAAGITRQKTGVGVYAKCLLDALLKLPDDFHFYILAQDDDPDLDFSKYANVTMIWAPARLFRLFPLRFLLEQIYIPYLLARHDIDVLHSLHYAIPCLGVGARRIVTFHDMTFFMFPELHERVKIIYFQLFMRFAARHADEIIFVSDSAYRDCVARLGQPNGAAVVIPHGKDSAYVPLGAGWDLSSLRNKYGIPERFVLYIGTIEPRKNLERLVTSFAAVASGDPDISLVLAGKMGWMMEGLKQTIHAAGLDSRVVLTGFILEEEKRLLLGACTVFVYPSLYEGFGLPVLEALACGAPTITSNTSSLPEVAGEAALLIDPYSTEELQAALQLLLTDKLLRDELRRRGPVQAQMFTWEACAAKTAKSYASLARGEPQALP